LYYWPHLVPVYPLALFSAAGLCAFICRRELASRQPWVRFALCTGVIVWVQLWIAWLGGMDVTFDSPSAIMASLLGPVAGGIITLPFAFVAFCTLIGADQTSGRIGIGVLGIGILVVPLIYTGAGLATLVPAAPLAVLTYGWASYHSLATIKRADRRISLKMLMLIFTWLSANLAAWRLAIDTMLATYATLPTEPPNDCFIASAAARGHTKFVGADRNSINYQLRLLKAGELILRHSAPRLHATLRWIYNRLGPRAARLLATRWLADLAYLGLKPCEWFARWLVHGVAGATRQRVGNLYRH